MRPTIIHLSDRKKPWRVTFRENERRRTRHFSRKIDAEAFAGEHGWEALDPDLAVSAEDRVWISRARIQAEAFGLSVGDVFALGIEAARGARASAYSLEAAVEAYHTAQDLAGARVASLGNIKRFLGFFRDWKGADTPVGQCTPVDVLRWARARYSNSESMRTAAGVVIAFFRWAAAAERGWCGPEWFARIRLRSELRDRARIAIIEPAQCQAFFDALPPAYQPGFALAFFAGVRPEELVPADKAKARLAWEDIDFEARTIEIRAAVSKVRKFRVLHDVFPQVWAALEAVPEAERVGSILSLNLRNFRKLRRAAADRAELPRPWPVDLARHSYATYSYHIYGLETTINNTGHEDRQSTFFRHYKGATWGAKAKAYAAIQIRETAASRGLWYAAGGGRRKKKPRR